ncbi:MAG: protein kinase [Chloroflexi bacterium]|nr:protein kinase [Chloroflexota bacterium]
MTLSVGELLQNRYRIEGLLGRGGMGAVYRAYDLVLSTPVAIKENLNSAGEAIRQFKREAVLLASLRHGNLPRVTDHFVLGSRQYLVMDYVAGEDLKTRLERESPLAEPQVLAWAKEICSALSYLHTRQPAVIHRDVKPANIKLTPDGHPILVDFGIAKVADVGGGTSTGARSLTPGFAPPEQYGSRPTDSRSDQYSLAATLYNLLTGTIPPDSLERTLGQSNLRPASEVNPKVSPAVEAALTRALQLNPEDRYPSTADFYEGLLGRGLPPPPPRPAAAPPNATVRKPVPSLMPVSATAPVPAKPARRFPWVVTVLLSLTVLTGIAVVALLYLLNPPVPDLPLTPEVVVPAALDSPSPLPQASPTAVPVVAPIATATPTATLAPTQTAAPTALPTPLGGSSLIIFASTRSGDGFYQLFALDLADGSTRQLTFDGGNKGHPHWSPDGQRIVYEAESADAKKRDIFIINADGSGIQNLSNNPADDYYPAWNPRGDRIAFVSNRTGGAAQIFFVRPDGSGLINISKLHRNQPEEWDPAWSSDGRYLYLVRKPNGPVRIWRWDPATPDVEPLTTTMFAGDYYESVPALSPRGDLMAYVRLVDGGRQICVSSTDLDQKKPCDNPLTSLSGNIDPAWSPDGRMIVFSSLRDGNEELYVMTVTGAGQRNITASPSRDRQPDWQPVPGGATGF